MKKYLLFTFLFFFVREYSAQAIYTQKDVEVCNSRFQMAVDKDLASLPINQVIIEIGKSFLGTDYVANTIESGDEEKPVINLTGLDCYTFLEAALVFSRCIKKGQTTFEDYQNELINIRYRDGKLNGYPSRLHYFSDWIYDMNKRGIGKDITGEIGGIPFIKKINFMSTHISSYRQLKNNPEFVREIEKTEKEISLRKYLYIPQDKIPDIDDKIENGDIIGITTNVDGLDISHTGIAVRMDDGRIHFMHAPNVGYKVQITDKPLSDYIKGIKKQTGIMILRPL
ncbi:MAG: DUF1460 domain-containing protein [Ignavibacteriae bacterium HGW-Ignavibacteriae-3]|nr:MAG: DUF1460 domain-containing protein [Ignavibacteriae bacterium HGW-Ignavibacteriae-3]